MDSGSQVGRRVAHRGAPRFALQMLAVRRSLPYFGGQAMIFPSTAATWHDPNNFAKQWRTAREALGVP